jgi:hypothetical protein
MPISEKKLDTAWKMIVEDSKPLAQAAAELKLQPATLRAALIKQHGQQEFMTAVRDARSNRIPDGSHMLKVVKHVVENKKPQLEQIDKLIDNMEAALDLLYNVRDEV